VTPRQIIPAFAAVAAAATLLAGCGGSDSNASSPPKSTTTSAKQASGASGSAVTISNFKFAPASLTVKSGAKVTVTNDDSTAHTFTADDGNSFDTGDLDPGSAKTVSVSKPGSYPYHCNIHSFMKGTLVVR
jgi:plastocyanin